MKKKRNQKVIKNVASKAKKQTAKKPIKNKTIERNKKAKKHITRTKTKPTSSISAAATPQKKISKPTSMSANVSKGANSVKSSNFPQNFPFWARLKIEKHRTTLIIDEEPVINKKTKKIEDGFVHRESTHTYRKNYEEIKPNPNKDDDNPMYLKRPAKKPKRLFEPHNKDLDMPNKLKERYAKNNNKTKK